MVKPLPLADLLKLLQERELDIGLREHLAVARLLSRWDDTDVDSLRDALAALLARSPEEVEKVREVFNELYLRPAEEPKPPPPPEEPQERRFPRLALLGVAAIIALGLVIGAWLWPRPDPPPPQPIASRPSEPPADGKERLPLIPDTYPQPDRKRVLAGAAGIAGGLLLALYRVRLRRATERAARQRWHEMLEELPNPQGYEIEVGDITPPFSTAVLEEAAALLGQRTPMSPRYGDLDVNRTLQNTLRAGLAPHVVFRSRAVAPPVVVLEDIGSEMAPLQSRISSLLAGLAARGAPLDRWQFHADADRVFRSLGDPEISLRQLARLRALSPLLVISTGAGVLRGWEGQVAPWVEQLAAWPHRAWLHPVGDPGSWHSVLRRPEVLKTPIWPMTAEGLLAVARHLRHGRPGAPSRATYRTAADRPVTPLDIDRLRWLLARAPRPDPTLLERLRQRFCPHVPPAALFEALEAPPLAASLGLPPASGEVHAFLADLVAASEPQVGTAAYERWRFDRALQEIRVPGREATALAELADLAQGPLAGLVGDAVEELTVRSAAGLEPPISGWVARSLRRQVLLPIRDRAFRTALGWRRLPSPGWTASVTALLAALLAVVALPDALPAFTREVSVRQETRYELRLRGPGARTGSVRVGVVGNARWRDVPKDLVGAKTQRLPRLPASLDLPESARGSWYYVRDAAPEDGVLGISNFEWVDRSGLPPDKVASASSEGTPSRNASSEGALSEGTPPISRTETAPSTGPAPISSTVSLPLAADAGAGEISTTRSEPTSSEMRAIRVRELQERYEQIITLASNEEMSTILSWIAAMGDRVDDEGADLDIIEENIRAWEQYFSVPPPPLPTYQRTTIYFIEGSSYLDDIARASLDEVAEILKKDSELIVRVTAQGDAGEEEKPEGFANLRADEVSSYLITSHGIDPGRFQRGIDLELKSDETESDDLIQRIVFVDVLHPVP